MRVINYVNLFYIFYLYPLKKMGCLQLNNCKSDI